MLAVPVCTASVNCSCHARLKGSEGSCLGFKLFVLVVDVPMKVLMIVVGSGFTHVVDEQVDGFVVSTLNITLFHTSREEMIWEVQE
jgi:hypothetical protein